MQKPVLTCLGLSALLLAASCAPTTGTETAETPRAARQCFTVQQVTNFRQGRTDQVLLRVGRDEIYELGSVGGCPGLDFALRLAILPDIAGASGSRLCTGDWVRIVAPDPAMSARSCRAIVNRKLTEAEVAALPAAHRP